MFLVLFGPSPTGAVAPGAAVAVRVYDAASASGDSTDAALAIAGTTLRSALVEVRWKRCAGPDRCQQPLGPGELALRLVRAPRALHVTGALPLGDALVDARLGRGVLATIYVDRVERLAAASDHDATLLLGRTVAHELGHLLLASTTHTAAGLMRATWSRDEIRLGRQADWVFTASEVAEIQARLNGQRGRCTSAKPDTTIGRAEPPAPARAPSGAFDDAQLACNSLAARHVDSFGAAHCPAARRPW